MKFPLFKVHKVCYKFGFLDGDGENYLRLSVSEKFSVSLIRLCNSDSVMGNAFFFIIFLYFTKISINYPTHPSKTS